MNIKRILAGMVAPVMALTLVGTAHAAIDLDASLDKVNEEAGYADAGEDTLLVTVGSFISILLGLLGVICLILVIWAGFLWMTAGGDDKAVAKAKTIMTNAIIGLVILLSAYAISAFVLDQVSSATGQG